MTTELVEVKVADNMTLQSWKDGDGEIIVGLRWVCEAIGVNWSGQLQKVRNNPIFNEKLRCVDIHTPGGKQKTIGLPLDLFMGFLTSINAASVSERAREPLLIYQRESFKALRDYWTTGVAIRPEAEALSWFDMMRAQIDKAEAIDREVKAHAQQLSEHQSQIEQVQATTQMLIENAAKSTLTAYCKLQRIGYGAFPSDWRAECRDDMKALCTSRGIKTPVVEFSVDGQLRKETEFPISILEEIVEPWLMRKNSQLTMREKGC